MKPKTYNFIYSDFVFLLAIISCLIFNVAWASEQRAHDGYYYLDKDNKLLINPSNDERFVSGLLLFNKSWFETIKYFNRDKYDIEATSLSVDGDIPLLQITTAGEGGPSFPRDSISFRPYVRDKILDGNGVDYYIWFNDFYLYTPRFEVSGMQIGDSRDKVSAFLGLSKNRICDTIVIVNPSDGRYVDEYKELFKSHDKIILKESISRIWKRIPLELFFIFDKDTIKEIKTTPGW